MTSLEELKSAKHKLIGPRVYLRALDIGDATEDYSRWFADPMVTRFLGTKSATVSELKQYIIKKNQKNDTIFLGIFLKKLDTKIGTIKLEYIDHIKGTADIAIMLGDRSHAGKGLGGEAMQTLIDYAFSDLNLSEITLGVVAQNTVAVRAYKKLGFKETKRMYQIVHYGTETYDQVAMSLKRGD